MPKKIKINHPSREFLIKFNGKKKKVEYYDDFETQEIQEIIKNYNELILKHSLMIFLFVEDQFIKRHDNKKIIISNTASQAIIFIREILRKNLG